MLAVSKTRPPEDLREAFAAGQHAFGENYLQEALKKIEPRDVSLLRKALGHKDRYVRGFACSCLGKLGAGAKDALGDLRKASRTRSRTLRDLIQKTIKKIEADIQRSK